MMIFLKTVYKYFLHKINTGMLKTKSLSSFGVVEKKAWPTHAQNKVNRQNRVNWRIGN